VGEPAPVSDVRNDTIAAVKENDPAGAQLPARLPLTDAGSEALMKLGLGLLAIGALLTSLSRRSGGEQRQV
jgi:hypothetical protein